MNIKIETENCNFENHYLIEEAAESKISIILEHERIVSTQSKARIKNSLTKVIQDELSKFKWIISGEVIVDFTWYLNAVEKQETDKIGDIDNISKPIQDSLIGKRGILIDDSQIAGLYSTWFSRDKLISDNILRIDIKFNNDYTLQKENLKFIQYDKAICMPMRIDLNNIKDLFIAKIIIHTRKQTRKASHKIKRLGVDVGLYFICSQWDFHRTRISGFDSDDILTMKEFNDICLSKGLTYFQLLKRYKDFKNK